MLLISIEKDLALMNRTKKPTCSAGRMSTATADSEFVDHNWNYSTIYD
jgi:hypothetical protein